MSDAPERLATWEDLLAFPEDVRVELIAGSIASSCRWIRPKKRAERRSLRTGPFAPSC